MHDTPKHSHRRTPNWSVRAPCGDIRELRSLLDMAKLLLDGEITSEAEISSGDGHWRRMADVIEPEGFGQTLRALGHLDA